MRLRARHYATAQMVDVVCDRGTIQSVGPPLPAPVDLEGGWVAPALFDLQINGCDGRGFSSTRLTVEDVRHIVAVCRRHGIGGLCPTLVTNSYEALAHGMSVIRNARESERVLAAA